MVLFTTAFWRTGLLDYKPFETWAEEGSADTETLASRRVETLISQYQAPHMDPSVLEALDAYIAQTKETAPDAFA